MAMHRRVLLLTFGGGLIGAAIAFVACSSGPASQDAGLDGGPADAVSVFETSPPPDTFVAMVDAGRDTGSRDDAQQGSDARQSDGSVEAHAVDSGALAMCSIVTGACDIVSQNCSNGSECVAIFAPDGGIVTQCVADQPNEVLHKGAPCCPSSDGTNPCLPGLECNGGGFCTGNDGGITNGLPNGWGGSRCTPHCCMTDGGAEESNCGAAPDGGPQGYCDLETTEYNICSYPSGCVLLRGPECMTGFGCELAPTGDGGAGCTVLYLPDGGNGASSGESCYYSNSCADGLVCIGSGDAGTCSWMCHLAGAAPPFDAGLLRATPGYGGCPTGQTCEGIIGFPSWLGACIP